MMNKILSIAKISSLLFRDITSISDGSGIIAEFENAFKNYIGTKYALATNNGTSALHSAYFSLGLKADDQVILPSYTWHSTLAPLFPIKVKPVFSEIDPDTLTLDPYDVEKRINNKTKAIILVHLWGNVCDLKRFLKLKREYGLSLVQDCSHCIGAKYQGIMVGSLGDVSCFSLQGSKAVSAGEGGVLITNTKTIYKKALSFGRPEMNNLKNKNLSYDLGFGYKYRPHPFAMVLALNNLKFIDVRIKKELDKLGYLNNKIINSRYVKNISKYDNVELGSIYGYRGILRNNVSFNLALNRLKKEGLKIKKEFYPLLHKASMFNNKIKLPITEKIYKKIVSFSI